jgi:hypothetical protein
VWTLVWVSFYIISIFGVPSILMQDKLEPYLEATKHMYKQLLRCVGHVSHQALKVGHCVAGSNPGREVGELMPGELTCQAFVPE